MKKLLLPFAIITILGVSCQQKDAVSDLETPLAEPEALTERTCASDEVLQKQMAADPLRRTRLEEIEASTRRFLATERPLHRAAGKLYVPVVVHVVLPDPNSVTDDQIQTQINVLNADFNRTNTELSSSGVYLAGYPWSQVANCELEFYVKQVRRVTASGTFSTNDAVKRTSTPVNGSSMLNLWVCDLSRGLLGYAQFPGGSPATDGVVVDYQAFGTSASYPMYVDFKLGRTATHEVGHWFNLRHIWGDIRCGNDLVDDTPQHDGANSGCPAVGSKSKCTGKPLEMWMNYMDYTADKCMYMFTAQQKARMDAAIDAANGRKNYVYTTKI